VQYFLTVVDVNIASQPAHAWQPSREALVGRAKDLTDPECSVVAARKTQFRTVVLAELLTALRTAAIRIRWLLRYDVPLWTCSAHRP
jgi:hypothetical protein